MPFEASDAPPRACDDRAACSPAVGQQRAEVIATHDNGVRRLTDPIS